MYGPTTTIAADIAALTTRKCLVLKVVWLPDRVGCADDVNVHLISCMLVLNIVRSSMHESGCGVGVTRSVSV